MREKLKFSLLYLGKPRWDSGVSPPELLEFIQSHPTGNALDLGCGTGTNVITLAQHGWQVTGVDFVKSAIRTARRKARQAKVPAVFIHQDVSQLQLNQGSFDLILDIGCFHNLNPVQRTLYLQNVQRLLSNRGTYLLYGFLYTDLHMNGPGISEQDLQAMQTFLHLKWKIESLDHFIQPSVWLSFSRL